MHIYLDESGNLTTSNTKYFIVGSFSTSNPKKIENAFRRWQTRKFPRTIRNQTEVKFNDSHINDELRLKTIKYFVSQDIKIHYTYLKRKNIPEEYYRKGKVYETGLLYTEIVAATLELYLPVTKEQFIVIRDPRTLKGVTIERFNETIKTSLLPKLPAKISLDIKALESTSSAQVQVADWICGALARYYETKSMGKELYEILKPYIFGKRELFADYWTKKWKK